MDHHGIEIVIVPGSELMTDHTKATSISLVIPSYNEGENLPETVPPAIAALASIGIAFEVLIIDDGSTDDTVEVVRSLSAKHPEVRGIRLRRNAGKAAALSVGFSQATGDVIVMMDADGQDEPTAIPALVATLESGYDLVTGRRADRNDRFIKRHTSKLYNATTSWISGVPGRDFNSGLKVMRRDVVENVDLYGELHRYLPVLAAWSGFRVTEVEVEHHTRLHGTTKYGIARFWRGIFDLVTVKFLTSYNRRPFHLFGGMGIISAIIGSGLLIWMFILHLAGTAVGTKPAVITGVLFEVVAVQLLSTGLVGELLVYLNRSRDGERSLPATQDITESLSDS
ncbi:MAG: glycosyltransferase family 2 protein [Actinomycetes bacterium]